MSVSIECKFILFLCLDDSDLNVGNGEDDDDELSNSKQAGKLMISTLIRRSNC